MKTVAFKMKLNPGRHEEYKKRHEEIWPELKILLQEAGILEYSIWLDEETNILFAFQKKSDEVNPENLSQNSIMQKWWESLAHLMVTLPDYSPKITYLKEMFKM